MWTKNCEGNRHQPQCWGHSSSRLTVRWWLSGKRSNGNELLTVTKIRPYIYLTSESFNNADSTATATNDKSKGKITGNQSVTTWKRTRTGRSHCAYLLHPRRPGPHWKGDRVITAGVLDVMTTYNSVISSSHYKSLDFLQRRPLNSYISWTWMRNARIIMYSDLERTWQKRNYFVIGLLRRRETK